LHFSNLFNSSPAARNSAHLWADKYGILWLYGGGTSFDVTSELWSYNISQGDGVFTFVRSGTMNPGSGLTGYYANYIWPGPASGGAYWYKASTDELFLFGGYSAAGTSFKKPITCGASVPQEDCGRSGGEVENIWGRVHTTVVFTRLQELEEMQHLLNKVRVFTCLEGFIPTPSK
jgi:hypothetical protein